MNPAPTVIWQTPRCFQDVMDSVRTFCFEHNLLGEKVKSKDAIGIAMPSATLGSRQNVKLRFDPAFMKLAADAKL